MTSDKGGRLDTLYWSNPYSKMFLPNCSYFVLIRGTHKIYIYIYISLIVTTIVDSLGKSVPIAFLVASSEHSDSITR